MRALAATLALVCIATSCAPAVHDVTWGDVAPRLAASCVAGHASSRTVAGARAEAHAMLAMVEAGLMPPPGVDRSGACGSFAGRAPFTDDDEATLRAWIEGGLRDGPAPDAPALERTAPDR